MKFFRLANDPTEREKFLVSAVTASGFTPEQVDAAHKANAVDFLSALKGDDKSAELAAALAEKEKSAKLIIDFSAAMTASGFTTENLTSADAFRAALDERVKKDAAALAVDIAASRGIAPVKQEPDTKSDRPTATKEQFDAMTHEKRNEFMRSGGKLES